MGQLAGRCLPDAKKSGVSPQSWPGRISTELSRCGDSTMNNSKGWNASRNIAAISLRVRQAVRAELEEFAARERRKLGNVSEVILEWGFEQLKLPAPLTAY